MGKLVEAVAEVADEVLGSSALRVAEMPAAQEQHVPDSREAARHA